MNFNKQLKTRLQENMKDAKKVEAVVSNKEHKARRQARYHYREAVKRVKRRKLTPNVVLQDG